MKLPWARNVRKFTITMTLRDNPKAGTTDVAVNIKGKINDGELAFLLGTIAERSGLNERSGIKKPRPGTA